MARKISEARGIDATGRGPDDDAARPPDSGDSAPAAVATEPEVVESPEDKFRRLGNKRLPDAIKALARLTNLGNKKVYGYTPQQASIVLSEIDKAVKRLKDAFADVPTGNGAPAGFF